MGWQDERSQAKEQHKRQARADACSDEKTMAHLSILMGRRKGRDAPDWISPRNHHSEDSAPGVGAAPLASGGKDYLMGGPAARGDGRKRGFRSGERSIVAAPATPDM
jgi:hypothetical protein